MIARLLSVLEARRRFKAALTHNARYTFSVYSDAPHSWMCPKCNRVQRAHSTSKFFGPQFDSCCGLPEGSRNQRRLAMPWRSI